MPRFLFSSLLFAAAGLAAFSSTRMPAEAPPAAAAPPAPPPPTPSTPTSVTFRPGQDSARVEMVFVIDTTASMGGLIDGAKETVWSVIDDLASQTPRPELRVGLVAFRDRGDDYVTRVVPLTEDLDAIYGELLALTAGGGGDGPESVAEGLSAAVDQMAWTQAKGVYRTVTLVGDAPDHAYPDGISLHEALEHAKSRGLVIGATQCGNALDAAEDYRAVAQLGGGTYRTVAADGGVLAFHAPMDAELLDLRDPLLGTAVPFGGTKLPGVIAEMRKMSASSWATRAAVMAKMGRLTTADGDLVDALSAGRLPLSDVDRASLPKDLRGLSDAALLIRLDALRARRNALLARIAEITARRERWVETERAERARAGIAQGFEAHASEDAVQQLQALGYIN